MATSPAVDADGFDAVASDVAAIDADAGVASARWARYVVASGAFLRRKPCLSPACADVPMLASKSRQN